MLLCHLGEVDKNILSIFTTVVQMRGMRKKST